MPDRSSTGWVWEEEYWTEYVIALALLFGSLLGFVFALRCFFKGVLLSPGWFADVISLAAVLALPPFFRRGVWIPVVLLVFALFLGYVDELRGYYEALPVLLLLAAQSIAVVLGVKMTPLLGNILGNTQMAAATYRPAGGADNTVFIINRRLATEVPPLEHLENYLSVAPPEVQNSFAYTVTDDRYMVVGSFNAEEESVQHVVAEIVAGLGR